MAFVAGHATSISPLFRGIPFDDFDQQQASEDDRTCLIYHWSPARPEQFQVTDGKRYLLPSIEVSNTTIEDVLLRHVMGKNRHFAVYGGPSFFCSGAFFANHWSDYYKMIEGAVYCGYLIGPNNPQFDNFYQVRAGGYGPIAPGCECRAKAHGTVMPDSCIQVTLGPGGSIENATFVMI